MPRNSSGTYSLPSGNPVVSDTLIETAWANPTMTDLGSEITNSLDRQGRGTMLAPLKLVDGTNVAPAVSFNSEASTGMYRPASHVLGLAVAGIAAILISDTTITLNKAVALTGGMSLTAPLTLPAGTEALPALTFTGDLDTGLWHPAANTLAWSTNAVERMRLNTVGLGVGVSAANGFALEAQGATVNSAIARFSGDTVQTRGLELASYAVGAVNGVGFRFNNPGSGANDGNTAFSFGGVTPDVVTMHAAGVSLRSTLTNTTLLVDRSGVSTAPTGGFTAGTAASFIGNGSAGSGTYIAVNSGNAANAGINFGDTDADSRGWVRYNHASEWLHFGTAGTTAAYLDSVNRLLVNSNGVAYTANGFTQPTMLQDASITAGQAGLGMSAWYGATTAGTRIIAMKSRSAVLGTHTIVANGDSLMTLVGAGSDGTEFMRATNIEFQVDGAPAVGSVPGRIIFSTTPVGGAAPVEAMRIAAAGNITMTAPASGNTLDVAQIDGASAIITNDALAGGVVQWRLENTSNTANSQARLQVITAGATANDPSVQFTVSGAQSWSMGIDNSASDAFKISAGAALGTNDALSIATNGAVTVTAPTVSTPSLDVDAFSGNYGVHQSQSLPGANVMWRMENTDNTDPASHVRLTMVVGGASGGDPYILLQAATSVSLGIDNSDDDSFVISEATTLGTANRFRIDRTTNLCESGIAVGATVDDLSFATTAWVWDTQLGGQLRTWQNMTGVGGRALAAAIVAPAYPIEVNITFAFPATAGTVVTLTAGGITVASRSNGTAGAYVDSVSAVVPAGATYSLTNAVGVPTINTWAELR